MSDVISIADAKVGDLRAFAEVMHGLEVPPRATRAAVLALLESAGIEVGETIPRLGAQPNPDDGEFGKQQAMPAEIARAGRVMVLIAKEKGGIDPVTVGVNGYFISIKRGVKASIPHPHYEALVLNATELDYPTDENGQITGEPSEIPRFPVQVFGAA